MNTQPDVAESKDGADQNRSMRPTTARRRPPKVRDGAQEMSAKDSAPVGGKKAEGILIDGQDIDVIDNFILVSYIFIFIVFIFSLRMMINLLLMKEDM